MTSLSPVQIPADLKVYPHLCDCCAKIIRQSADRCCSTKCFERIHDPVTSVELRKVKFSASLSEETNAFTAEVFINGHRAGFASNHGTGGDTEMEPMALYHRLKRHTDTLPPVVCKDMKDPHDPTKPFSYPMNPSALIDELLIEVLREQDVEKLVKQMKNRILYLRIADNALLKTKVLTPDRMKWNLVLNEARLRAECEKNGEVCINLLPPAEQRETLRKGLGI